MAVGDAAAIGRFEFATAARIVFGAGTLAELPGIVAGLGQRPVLITGANGPRFAPGFTAVTTLRVAGEPTVALALDGARQLRAAGGDVVVAIGGGSVIDAGKAIAALAANPGDPLDYLEVVGRGQPLPHPALPIIAVPTTAGTGAEVTRNAVLAVPESQVKVSLRSIHMLPRVALVDPVLTLELPAAQTAASGLDALTQLIEPYLSCRANAFTDALCRDAIPRAAWALPIVCRQPRDLAARSALAFAALQSGHALANAGLGAVHGFAGPIGGMFPAPHGAVCAALLPGVLRANLAAMRARAPQHPSLARMAEVGQWLTSEHFGKPEDAVDWCASLVRELAIPPLSAWGIRREHVPEIAAKAARASSMKGNPLPLTDGELRQILESALGNQA